MNLKKGLLGLAIAIACILTLFLPLALGLMAGFPFALWMDEEVEPVGARATFEESADCLFQYRYYNAGRDLGVRLNSEEVAFCFPPQTAAKKKALIACFNRYERNHPDQGGWPEDNMWSCTWDGLTAVPTPFAFGKVVAVPPVPRAGKRCVLKIGVTGSDSAEEEVNAAIETGSLDVLVTIGGVNGIPLDIEYGFFYADGKIHVNFTVPKTAEGKRLTIKLKIGADIPTGTKIVAFTVGR
jgi:hypothetical protein